VVKYKRIQIIIRSILSVSVTVKDVEKFYFLKIRKTADMDESLLSYDDWSLSVEVVQQQHRMGHLG
jgi:hypothetical protein